MDKLPIITLEVQNDLRYKSCGDYFYTSDNQVVIQIKEQISSDYEFLISVHELIEWYLTERVGIKEEDIMAYDLQWEKDNPTGLEEGREPGNDPSNNVYKEQHLFAEKIERLLADYMKIDWEQYEKDLKF